MVPISNALNCQFLGLITPRDEMYNIMAKALMIVALIATFTERGVKGCPSPWAGCWPGTPPQSCRILRSRRGPVFVQTGGEMKNLFHQKGKGI